MSETEIETLLYEHREDALTCYDHQPTGPNQPIWCCVCGAHNLTVSWRRHIADALRDLLARERVAALLDAADDLELLVDARHPAALNPDQWLRDRADKEAPR